MATFTHASGVEPAGAFQATIHWGDGTTSLGVITLSGGVYIVKGSHTYSNTNRHTITTTVLETGNSPVVEGGNKVDVDPATLPLDQRDLVRLPQDSGGAAGSSPQPGGWEDSQMGTEVTDGFFSFEVARLRMELLAGGRSDAWADWFDDFGA